MEDKKINERITRLEEGGGCLFGMTDEQYKSLWKACVITTIFGIVLTVVFLILGGN